MQNSIVGGFIQAVEPFEDPNVLLLCNEEAKLLGLPENRFLRNRNGIPYDIIHGTFFLAQGNSESFCSLTDKQIQTYVPDELDEIPAHASACGMIYSFYGRLSVGNMDPDWLRKRNLPPTFYVYGTEDPFYRQFNRQYEVISGMGIPTGRIVLNGWPHGFGSDGGWVRDYNGLWQGVSFNAIEVGGEG